MHVDTWANCISRFHHQFSFPPEVPHYMTLQYVTMQYHRLTPINQEWKKKLHFLDLHSLLYLPFQLSRLEDSFLCLSPLSFLNHSKSKHFHLIPTIFFVVVGNSFAQLYSSSSFMLYILWIFKDIFKKTFSWICCFGRRGIFFLSVGTIGFWVQHIVLIDTNKIYW